MVLKEALGTMKPHYRTNQPGKFLVHHRQYTVRFHVHVSSHYFVVNRGRFTAEAVFETRKEYIATLNSAVSKYRLVIVISDHLAHKDKYRTRDGYLNLDPSCSGRFPTYNILIRLPITFKNTFWK